MEQIIPDGALLDTRSEEEKKKDFTSEEILGESIIVPEWIEKTDWIKLPSRNQVYSLSCGGQSTAKAVTALNNGLVMSATPIYRFRSNYPSGGMSLWDMGNILIKKRTTTEALSPSQMMTEEQMNTAEIPVDLPYGVSAYYYLKSGETADMDTIAIALEKGHPVIIGMGSIHSEYKEVPTFSGNTPTFNHYVCVVPKNYTLYKGEKAVIIDDSADLKTTIDGKGQRIFTESFIKARSWGIMALIPATQEPKVDSKPKHTFNTNLVFGMRGPEIKALQACLVYEGFLKPTLITGYFGELTMKGVMEFQNKYRQEILIPARSKSPTGKVMKYTRLQLNKLYS